MGSYKKGDDLFTSILMPVCFQPDDGRYLGRNMLP
jgi:hypothetical protein